MSRTVWAVLVGSDPGLLRLRLGLRATVAVSLAVGVDWIVGPALGIPTVVAMLLGGMVGMNASFGTTSRAPLDAARTVAAFPLAALVGVLPATLVHGHKDVTLALFVVVMIAAVYVRRFGPRFFNYGMIAWLLYFFTAFVGFGLDQLGAMMAVVTASAACALLTATVIVPDRPEAMLAAALRAFDVRIGALAAAGRDALTGELPPDRVERTLHGRGFRVVEAALLIDGYLASPGIGPEVRPAAVRHDLLAAELAANRLTALAADLGSAGDLPAGTRASLVAALDALHVLDLAAVRRGSAELIADVRAFTATSAATARLVRDVAHTLDRLVDALTSSGSSSTPPHVRDYAPAVNLNLGNLPSAASSASAVLEDRETRLTLNTRLCTQVALAASITVALGSVLSDRRYYWAVLACFLALTGTFTTGEIAMKGFNRVIGTLLGLFAATFAVRLTGRDDAAIVAVMLVCVFLGLYFYRVSYAVMAFAVTTVMGELYAVLGEFSEGLLLLRLAETALGAAVGIGVALVVLPIRTADARAAAYRAFVDDLAALLGAVRDRLATGERVSDLFLATRQVDAALHQLALVARPQAGATLIGLAGRRGTRELAAYTEAAYRARALAAAVAALPPGRRPALAAACGAVLAAVESAGESVGESAGPWPRGAVGPRGGPGDRTGDQPGDRPGGAQAGRGDGPAAAAVAAALADLDRPADAGEPVNVQLTRVVARVSDLAGAVDELRPARATPVPGVGVPS